MEFPELGAVWVDATEVDPSEPAPRATPDSPSDGLQTSGDTVRPLSTPLAAPSRPSPQPTPTLDECLDLSWGNRLSPSAPGQILVDIEVHNRCGRDLDAMDVWFAVNGRSGGATVHLVRGHLFEPLDDGDHGDATIALPGSPDYYDEILVEIIPQQ